jgi:hypothetical protein
MCLCRSDMWVLGDVVMLRWEWHGKSAERIHP